MSVLLNCCFSDFHMCAVHGTLVALRTMSTWYILLRFNCSTPQHVLSNSSCRQGAQGPLLISSTCGPGFLCLLLLLLLRYCDSGVQRPVDTHSLKGTTGSWQFFILKRGAY